MQIFIRSVNNRTITLEVPSDISANELKDRVSDVEFLPAELFNLTHGSRYIITPNRSIIAPTSRINGP